MRAGTLSAQLYITVAFHRDANSDGAVTVADLQQLQKRTTQHNKQHNVIQQPQTIQTK